MCLPALFRDADDERALSLVETFSFANLITVDEGVPTANHLPFLLDRTRRVLRGHVARANPVWKTLAAGKEALVVFQGPHAYVSPSWYVSAQAHVPTWNYAAVHVMGVPRVIASAEELSRLVIDLTTHHEARRAPPEQRYSLDMDEPARKALLGAIVGFEIPLTRVESKAKMSQNRTPEDRAGAIAGLERSESPSDRDVAEMMRTLGE